MALLISAAVLAVGAWFHHRRDRPVLAVSNAEVFPRHRAVGYLFAVALLWVGSLAATVLELATGRSDWETTNAAVVAPGLVVMGVAVLSVLLTSRAIDRHDPEPSGPARELGRFVRLAYGTATVAAFRALQGRPYP